MVISLPYVRWCLSDLCLFPFLTGQHDEEAIKAFPHHGAIDIDQVTLANGIALKWPASVSVVVPLK